MTASVFLSGNELVAAIHHVTRSTKDPTPAKPLRRRICGWFGCKKEGPSLPGGSTIHQGHLFTEYFDTYGPHVFPFGSFQNGPWVCQLAMAMAAARQDMSQGSRVPVPEDANALQSFMHNNAPRQRIWLGFGFRIRRRIWRRWYAVETAGAEFICILPRDVRTLSSFCQQIGIKPLKVRLLAGEQKTTEILGQVKCPCQNLFERGPACSLGVRDFDHGHFWLVRWAGNEAMHLIPF